MIIFIPARSGSKSIKDKNIKLLGGKPLIQWSIETAKKLGYRTIVSTDSKQYAEIASKLGVEVIMRSAGISRDITSMFEVIRSEWRKIQPLPDNIILFQPTSPFRDVCEIKKAIKAYEKNVFCDSLIGVEEVPEKYNPFQVIIESGRLRTQYCMANGEPVKNRITRRQSFPRAYIPTGSLYIFQTHNFIGGSLYGLKPMIFEMKPTININSLSDFKLAEEYASHL